VPVGLLVRRTGIPATLMAHEDILPEEQQLAKAWVAVRGKYSEAWESLDHLIHSNAIAALRVIEEIHHLLMSAATRDMDAWGLLAAGPLEDLLADRGCEVIDLVEQLAKQQPEFRKLLSGVWKHGMDDELYARVQKASDPTFKFA